jgi:hypothetical protein
VSVIEPCNGIADSFELSLSVDFSGSRREDFGFEGARGVEITDRSKVSSSC